MGNIIQEIIQIITNNYETELKKLILEGKDISEFILETKKMLDNIGVKLVAEALQIIDLQVRENKDRIKNWRIKSKDDGKSISTIFGEVKYTRTYYENKKTGEYKYLSDEMVGIETHDRMDTLLKARLVEEAIETPYKRSSEKATEAITLTAQTVMNTIRELGAVENNIVKIKERKKSLKILYIEADEDHVALQTGKHVEPKLVYVHEGKEKIGPDRWKLKNARYFSGVYPDSDELWLEVADYIEEAYDTEFLESVFLSGDAARWIKNGASWIKKSNYVLDRYHLSKYVQLATAHIGGANPIMWNYINKNEKGKLKNLFKTIIESTETETKRTAVREAQKYILNNWEGIQNQYSPDYVGCSAEGHVSHILSSRLSSRPLGWSETGVDQMARLRAYKANGGKVYDLMLEKKKRAQKEARIVKLEASIVKKVLSGSINMRQDNIAALNKGKKNWLYEKMKSFRGA